MSTCKYEQKVERWFDGELPDANGAVAQHVSECPVCTRYLTFLKRTRSAVETTTTPGAIGDAQFPAFWASVEDGLQGTPARRRPRGVWAVASLAAASLISAVALTSIYGTLGGGAPAVSAETEFIQFNSDLPGVEAVIVDSNGTPTLMLDMGDYDYAGDGDMM
jgi:hypothetical protein